MLTVACYTFSRGTRVHKTHVIMLVQSWESNRGVGELLGGGVPRYIRHRVQYWYCHESLTRRERSCAGAAECIRHRVQYWYCHESLTRGTEQLCRGGGVHKIQSTVLVLPRESNKGYRAVM